MPLQPIGAAGPPIWAHWLKAVMISGNGLQTRDVSTTIRVENGSRQVVDGPFADTKESLGGYVIIEVADLDAALEWASRAPCVTAGSVEIRPVLQPPAG